MRLYHNLNDGSISLDLFASAHVTSAIPVKSGQDEPLSVQFHRSGVPELLPTGSAILFGVKPLGKFEGAYLTSVAEWTAPGSAAGFYTASLPTDTTPINTLLAIDGDATNDIPSIPSTIAELQFTPPSAARPTKSLTFSLRIDNRVNQGGESDPDSATPYPAVQIFRFLPATTTYIGGAGSALDSIITVGKAYNEVCFNHATDGFRVYQLVTGTDAESSPAVIRPDDYDAGTNAKVWKLQTTGSAGGSLYKVADATARLALGGSNPAYGSTALQADTAHVWLLIDPANCAHPSSWIDIGMPAPTVIFSQTDGMTTGTTYSAFSGTFSGGGSFVYATGDGIWLPSPPAVDSSGVFQVGAVLVENLTALNVPGGPLTGTLLIGDASMGSLPPVAPNLVTLVAEAANLTAVNLWNLVHLANVVLSACTMLATVTFTNNNRISNFSADGCALTDVDAILAALGTTVTGGTVNLEGGTSPSPSTTTDTTRLVGESWTVITN